MATTKRIIDSALRSIGVLAAGEEARAAEMQDALLYAKQMLDSWSNETLLVPARVQETFSLLDQRTYTIGDGGDFDTTRPTMIDHLRIRESGGNETPVELTSLRVWAEIPFKDSAETTPDYAYYESSYPLGELRFDSNTTAGTDLLMTSTKPISDLPALTEETEFPPGYERAIRLGLAMELAPEYGKQVDQVMASQLRHARQVLKQINGRNRVGELKMDRGITGTRSYDIYSGPE